MDYPGGFITKTAPTLNPALGNAAPGVWRLNDVLKNIKAGTWPSYDPYFENTTLLLHGNGTNGGQNNTFLDSSSNNFTITRNGNTTQGTFSPFSQTGWSNYFDGSGDYLTFPNSSAFAFGAGAFTIEFWIYGPSDNDKFILGGRSAIGTMHITTGGTGSTGSTLRYVGSSTISSGSTLIVDNQWHHCAIVRDGSSNVTLYVDGVSRGTGTDTTNYTTTSGTWVMGANDFNYPGNVGSNQLTGYISNFRIVKGTAVYTSAFTPPTAPLTAITNTSLLICQSNRFVDNSASPITLTPNGSLSVQAFSPFAPTAAYSASTVGGSGYFDGSGDYLSVPDNAAFDFGTGEFTTECWVYFNNISGDQYVLSYDGGTTPDHIGINIYSGAWRIGGFNSYLITGSTGLIAQQWIHVVMTRQSNTLRAYINGVQLGTSDVTGISFNANNTLYIGGEFSSGGVSFNLNGYISGMRIVKGGNLYPNGTTFTPPTTPPTTTVSSGTVSLLCNFTNAAIIDNTAKNVLETVGNAQISTSVSKFGGASLAFDGNGDYLFTPSSVNFVFNGDFTIEFWVYRAGSSAGGSGNYEALVATYNGSTGYGIWWLNTTNVLHTRVEGTTADTTTALSNSTWYHVAVTRSGSTVRTFVNGVQGSSLTSSSTAANPGLYIGAQTINKNFNGYIDDLRITKGIARYTSNFTPQTSQWQDQ